MVACTVAGDLRSTSESIAPLDPPPCPITLVWSARDKIFPPAANGVVARQRIPAAEYLELPDVGHIPMIDHPSLCANIIRTTIQHAKSRDSGTVTAANGNRPSNAAPIRVAASLA